jgi:hypothetical protein
MAFPIEFIALVLGGMVGAAVALTGAGGGVLAVPLLVFGLHQSLPEAAPIALLSVALAAGLGALLGLREGLVRYRAAALMAAAGIAAAPLGLWLAQRLPPQPLVLGFVALLLWMARQQWRGSCAGAGHAANSSHPAPVCQRSPVDGRFIWNWACARLLVGCGFLAGLGSGLLGVGGGFILVPALTRHSDLDARSRILTSQATTALIACAGVASTLPQGRLDWGLGAPFAAGALLALLLTRRVAQRLSGPLLQRGFALLCLLAAALLLVRQFG